MGKLRAVIFDIDNTLVTVGNRKLHALLDVANDPKNKFIENIDCLKNTKMSDFQGLFEITENFDICKIPKDKHNSLEGQWMDKFLSNDYFYKDYKLIDKPIYGASKFVNKLYGKKYTIFYLSTRQHDPNSNDSTRLATLDEIYTYGFPLSNHAKLIMWTGDISSRKKIRGYQFKANEAEKIKKEYNVVATYDDSPRNTKSIMTVFPKAKHYVVTTLYNCSDYKKKLGISEDSKAVTCISDYSNMKTKF